LSAWSRDIRLDGLDQTPWPEVFWSMGQYERRLRFEAVRHHLLVDPREDLDVGGDNSSRFSKPSSPKR
jgi:hypothetical protein